MLQLMRLRKGMVPLSPQVTAPTYKHLIENLDEYLAQIAPSERWDLFHTTYHVKNLPDDTRGEFESLDQVYYDVDDIDPKRIFEYAEIVAKFHDISPDSFTINTSGGGMHVMIQLATPITSEAELKKLQRHYNAVIRKLDQLFRAAGLPTKTSKEGIQLPDGVWDHRRVFRLPGTENRKYTPPTKSSVVQVSFKKHTIDLVKLSGLPEFSEKQRMSASEWKKHPKPDASSILTGCEFMRWLRERPLEVREPQGYAGLSILTKLDKTGDLAREYIQGWTNSDSIGKWDADAKIDKADGASGPLLCETINDKWGKCQTCAYNGKVRSPISIKAPDFIASETEGFHDVSVGPGGARKLVPNVHDLRKFLEREADYRVLDRGSLFRWDGKKYEDTHPLFLNAFAEEHFTPKVKSSVIEEFINVVHRYNLANADWFSESTEGFANFQNGVLEWATGKLHAHDPARGFRYCLPFAHEPGAMAPRWEKFLSDVFEGDLDRVKLLEEFIGYCLSNDPMWEQKAMLLVGVGSNGKSTLIEVMQALTGKDNYSTVKFDKFNDPTHVHMMDGKLFNISGETPRRGFEESAGFKELIGGDTVTARKYYAGPYNFTNRTKIISACNEIPRSLDNTHGFYRRFWVVEFKRQFDPAHGLGEYRLADKLKGELPGIFNRVRSAYLAAKERAAFTAPKAVTDAVEAMREEMDTVGTWLKDVLVHEPGVELPNRTLYDRFAADMRAVGHDYLIRAFPAERISKRVAQLFPEATRFKRGAVRGFRGLNFHPNSHFIDPPKH